MLLAYYVLNGYQQNQNENFIEQLYGQCCFGDIKFGNQETTYNILSVIEMRTMSVIGWIQCIITPQKDDIRTETVCEMVEVAPTRIS